MPPARQYWPSLCLNSRPGPQGISTNIVLPKGGLLGYNVYYVISGKIMELISDSFKSSLLFGIVVNRVGE